MAVMILRAAKAAVRKALSWFVTAFLALRVIAAWLMSIRGERVWHLLSPPSRWSNLGDHAQTVAIDRWIRELLEMRPIELDKDEYRILQPMLRVLVRSEDLIIIQSGGNLGDRGMWTELLRRNVIQDFANNRILSLPQTIYFSPTEVGAQEAEVSSSVYRQHPDLVVLARDATSLSIGKELFQERCGLVFPDLVLYLPRVPRGGRRNGVLFCLRDDDESVLSKEEKTRLVDSVTPLAITRFNTQLDVKIYRRGRVDVLNQTFDLFRRHEIVVTDRFHGLIFSHVARSPCIVLGTVDHKLRSGVDWFADCPHVLFVESVDDVPSAITQLQKMTSSECDCDELEHAFAKTFFDLADRTIRWDFVPNGS